jgi:hypothetical protein
MLPIVSRVLRRARRRPTAEKPALPESALTGSRSSRPNRRADRTPSTPRLSPRQPRAGRSRSEQTETNAAQITLNEGLAWIKTLKKRHEELVALRNDNAHRERRFLGSAADREILKEPVCDVKALDRAVTRVARELRLLDQAMKATNARTVIERYDQDDSVLGELT